MYLDESVVRAVLLLVQTTMDAPVCIAGSNWEIWGLTDEVLRGKISCLLERCAEGGDISMIAADFSACIRPCQVENETLCYIVVLGEGAELLAPYVETLLQVEGSAFTRSHLELLAHKRNLLANQLAGSGQIDSEMKSYFRELHCTSNIPRCAVLCSLLRTGDHGLQFGDSGLGAMAEKWARDSELLSQEDIYGRLNTGLLLIFKAVPSEDDGVYRDEILRMAQTMSDYVLERTGGGARICLCVGSAYSRAEQLRHSYDEANFLYSNFEYCNHRAQTCVFINQFIFEYLYSRLDSGIQKDLIWDLRAMLEESLLLSETAVALSRNDSSPIRSAQELTIHRNTILQRLQKMKAAMAMDPLYSTRDRVALRTYALQKTKKTVWNAGVVVQPDSVLYQGLKHLSELLYQKSGGTFQVHIHTVSTSGDNRKLFQMLVSGSLDLVVGSTIALQPFTDGKVSTLQLPFLFDSEEQAEYILRKTVLPELKNSLREVGIFCADIWSMGWRYLTSRDSPIRVPTDLQGRRVRILASRSIEEYFNSLGAVPLQIYYNNIKDALASNIISCEENPYTNILSMEFYKYQDYVTELCLWYSMEALCFSMRSWEELEEERRAVLRQSVEESTRWLSYKQRRMNQEAKQELIRRGIKVIEPREDEIAQWKRTVGPLYDGETHREFLEKILGAKKQYAKKRN